MISLFDIVLGLSFSLCLQAKAKAKAKAKALKKVEALIFWHMLLTFTNFFCMWFYLLSVFLLNTTAHKKVIFWINEIRERGGGLYLLIKHYSHKS